MPPLSSETKLQELPRGVTRRRALWRRLESEDTDCACSMVRQPALAQGKTIPEWPEEKFPGRFSASQATLQRRLQGLS